MDLTKVLVNLGDAKALSILLDSENTSIILGSVPLKYSSEYIKFLDQNQHKEAVKDNFKKVYQSK